MITPYQHDEDGLAGAPWYVRAFVRVGTQTALIATLLWYLMTNVTGTLGHVADSQNELIKMNVVVIQNQERIIELLTQNAADQRRTRSVLLALCYNDTANQSEVERCNEALGNIP